MAVVAGGLPLLWLNRAHLPIPKTWQTNRPDAEQALVAPPLPRAATPPPVAAEPAAKPVGLPTAVASEATASPTSSATNEVPAANPAVAAKPAHRKPARKPVKAPPAKAADPARPCTEALAALGLCVPRQAEK